MLMISWMWRWDEAVVMKYHKLMIRFCDGLVRMKIVRIVFGG